VIFERSSTKYVLQIILNLPKDIRRLEFVASNLVQTMLIETNLVGFF